MHSVPAGVTNFTTSLNTHTWEREGQPKISLRIHWICLIRDVKIDWKANLILEYVEKLRIIKTLACQSVYSFLQVLWLDSSPFPLPC